MKALFEMPAGPAARSCAPGVSFSRYRTVAAPRGDEAAQLSDGAITVASTPGSCEIKRTRTIGPLVD